MGYVPMSAVRAQGGHEREAMRAFPPLEPDHPSANDGECAVCGEPLRVGDTPTVIPLGPGSDAAAQRRAITGGWYSCLGVIAHATCAGLGVDSADGPEPDRKGTTAS